MHRLVRRNPSSSTTLALSQEVGEEPIPAAHTHAYGQFRVTDSTVPPMQVFGVREKAPQGHGEEIQTYRTASGLHLCAAVNRKITGKNASQPRLQLQSVVEL